MLGERKHFDISVLTDLLSSRKQAYLKTISDILVLIFLTPLFLWGARFLSIASKKVSPVLGMQEHWMYLSIPVGAIIMILYSIINIYETFKKDNK